jgi:hypothetical protein
MKKTFTLAAAVHKLVAPEIQLDREIAERVGQEILRDQLEPGAWATALAASGGEKQDALAVYARIRIRKLATERRTRQAKSRSFEARRLTTCLGIKTVQDLLDRSNRGGRLNLLRPKLSVIWLLILMIGSTGSMACLFRLLEPLMPDRFERPALFSAPLLGIAVVGAALLSRALLPKSWVMQGWNTALAFVGSIACFGSLYLGTKVVARTPPAAIEQMMGQVRPASRPGPQKVRPAPVLVTPKAIPASAASTAALATGEE